MTHMTIRETAKKEALKLTFAKGLADEIADLTTAMVMAEINNVTRARDEEMRFMTGRIGDLAHALSELVAMETDRYACASNRNAAYARARKLLEPAE